MSSLTLKDSGGRATLAEAAIDAAQSRGRLALVCCGGIPDSTQLALSGLASGRKYPILQTIQS
jgi:hypothetical protein